jgi:hypothetical protein
LDERGDEMGREERQVKRKQRTYTHGEEAPRRD